MDLEVPTLLSPDLDYFRGATARLFSPAGLPKPHYLFNATGAREPTSDPTLTEKPARPLIPPVETGVSGASVACGGGVQTVILTDDGTRGNAWYLRPHSLRLPLHACVALINLDGRNGKWQIHTSRSLIRALPARSLQLARRSSTCLLCCNRSPSPSSSASASAFAFAFDFDFDFASASAHRHDQPLRKEVDDEDVKDSEGTTTTVTCPQYSDVDNKADQSSAPSAMGSSSKNGELSPTSTTAITHQRTDTQDSKDSRDNGDMKSDGLAQGPNHTFYVDGDGDDANAVLATTNDLDGDDGSIRAGVVYRTYKRRWFGLVQLTLLNIMVSWDVSIVYCLSGSSLISIGGLGAPANKLHALVSISHCEGKSAHAFESPDHSLSICIPVHLMGALWQMLLYAGQDCGWL